MSYPNIPWNLKARRLILKALQSLWNFTDGTAAQQVILRANYRAIGYFLYQYSGFDTSRESMPIVSKPLPHRRAERKNGSKTHSADPPRTPASAPPPHHHSGNRSQESGVFYLQQQNTSHQTMTEIPTIQRYNEIGTSLKRNNNLEWC